MTAKPIDMPVTALKNAAGNFVVATTNQTVDNATGPQTVPMEVNVPGHAASNL
jgi:hypothetical protein